MLHKGIVFFRPQMLMLCLFTLPKRWDGALITKHYRFEKPINFHVGLHILAERTMQHYIFLL